MPFKSFSKMYHQKLVAVGAMEKGSSPNGIIPTLVSVYLANRSMDAYKNGYIVKYDVDHDDDIF